MRLQCDVAIKVLPDAFKNDPRRLTRFEREAQTASNLNHPNILTIFEIGEVHGVHFMVAEFVPGETLGERLTRGSLVADAIGLTTQIASGVAAAHDAGVVHRDLKPDNVMVRPDGLVKVLDFGLAKGVDASPTNSIVETRAALTVEGTIAGTVYDMSPEQARGLLVDPRSDVFSLGAMLYEMLSGHTPFQGETATDVMVAILERESAPLTARRSDVPREVQAMVARCLEKDPKRRFGSARELLGASRPPSP